MKQEFRPAVEVVYAYGVAAILAWGLAAGAVLLAGLPQAYAFPLLQVVALIVAAYFALKSAQALWLCLTERYYIEGDWVRKDGGWVTRFQSTALLGNVRCTRVVTPLLFRAFSVGDVWIYTFDCHAIRLRNLKYPYSVADKIHPTQAPEPVFRPSVG